MLLFDYLFLFFKGSYRTCTDCEENLCIWAYFSVRSLHSTWLQSLIVPTTSSYFLYLQSVHVLQILYFKGIAYSLCPLRRPQFQSLEATITLYCNFVSSLSPRRLLPILLLWVFGRSKFLEVILLSNWHLPYQDRWAVI